MTLAGQRRQSVIAWIAVVLAVIVTVITLNRYIKDVDEAYQILNAQDWQNAPFAPLSALCGHVWGAIFGYSWLQMRWLSMFLNLTSIVIMAWWAAGRIKNTPRTLWILAATILLYGLANDHEQKYSWDTFASFSLTITAVVTMNYIDRPRWQTAAAAGCMAAITTLMRVPSAPVIAVPLIAVFLSENKVQRLRDFMIIALAWCACLLLIISLMYGSPAGFLHSVQANSILAHSPMTLITNTLQSGKTMTFYTMMFGVAVLVVKKCLPVQGMLRILLSLGILVILTIGVKWNNDRSLWCEYPLQGLMIFSLLLGILIGRGGSRADMFIMLLCGCCAVSGSNMAFNRMPVFPLIPAIVTFITEWPWWARRGILICFAAALITTFTLSVTNINVYINSFNHAKFGTSDLPKAQGVYFDKIDTEWIDEIAPAVLRYKNRPDNNITVLSEYLDGYLIEYLTDTSNPVTRHKWDKFNLRTDDPLTISSICTLAESKPDTSIAIVVYSPSLDCDPRRKLAPFGPEYTEIERGEHYCVFKLQR